ncbi:MAG: hypothetical protein ACRDZ4_00355 [Egibacteraceae bacterium]
MDTTCMYIIGGMAVAVVGMAGYIVRLHLARVADLRDWIKSMQEYRELLGLVGEVNRNKPPTGG